MNGIIALARAANGANDPNRTTSAAKVGTAGVNLKASAGRLYTLDVINTSTTAYYLLVFDLAAVPTNGNGVAAAVVWRRLIPAKSTDHATGECTLDFGMFGLACANGIGFAISTTPDALTLAGSDHVHYAAQWK